MKKLMWLGSASLIVACASISAPPVSEPTPLPVVPTMKTVEKATPVPMPSAAPVSGAVEEAPVPMPSAAPVSGALEEEAPVVKVVTAETQKVRSAENKLKVRPIKNEATDVAVKAGKTVGPIITFVGAARADGTPSEPTGKTADGWPIFINHVGSGFILVVEAKPGFSNLEPGRSIFRYDPEDPSKRPDLEIQVDRDLGDGSATVCDARPPNFGGVPGIKPTSFSETKEVSAALNDLACRFETFIESDASCTNSPTGDFSFISGKEATVQFCMVVARKWRFPEGDTTVSVRLRDREGNPGPVSKFLLRRVDRATRAPEVAAPATPTPVRRRP